MHSQGKGKFLMSCPRVRAIPFPGCPFMKSLRGWTLDTSTWFNLVAIGSQGTGGTLPGKLQACTCPTEVSLAPSRSWGPVLFPCFPKGSEMLWTTAPECRTQTRRTVMEIV